MAKVLDWIDREFVGPLGMETIPRGEALGRVVARNIAAGTDGPPYDRAIAGGYVLCAEKTFGASAYNPLLLPAIRISPGAPVPAGNDAALPFDHIYEGAGCIEVIEPVAASTGIERRGNDFRRGTVLLRAAHRMRAVDLALLAYAGIGAVDVVRRPRLRIIVGAELVDDPAAAMLRSLIERDGGVVEICPVDQGEKALRAAVAAPSADMLLILGASGLGPEVEVIRRALAPLGSLAICGVALRPGLSTRIGSFGPTPLFVLPGLPVHCLWAYEILAGRVLRRLAGRSPELPFTEREFTTSRKIVSAIGFVEISPVRRIAASDRVEPVIGATPDGAGSLLSLAEADGFVIVPDASEGFPPETRVRVYLYD